MTVNASALMHRHLTPRTLKRAQWFKDLTTALAEAEQLLSILEADGGFPAETVRLRARVQGVRSEIELLNRVMVGEGRVVSGSWPEPPRTGTADA
ncbi:MAG: hypothetical protein M3Q19_02945 [Pseudomonadota bacterium]|nr:hypothetical protein [Pseudomonadota bacterium]